MCFLASDAAGSLWLGDTVVRLCGEDGCILSNTKDFSSSFGHPRQTVFVTSIFHPAVLADTGFCEYWIYGV